MPGYVIAVGYKFMPSKREPKWYAATLEWGGRREAWVCDHQHANAAKARDCARQRREELIAADPGTFSPLRS